MCKVEVCLKSLKQLDGVLPLTSFFRVAKKFILNEFHVSTSYKVTDACPPCPSVCVPTSMIARSVISAFKCSFITIKTCVVLRGGGGGGGVLTDI